MCAVQYHPNQTLEPGSDGNRFISIEPGKPELYRGVLSHEVVKPAKIGGMWYPRPLSPETDRDKLVVIHYHGGAFVLGGCRPSQGGFAPDVLAKTFNGVAFAPQYRLAWEPSSHFPAAIQDGLTAYNYILSLGIPAENVVLSGDSAGGNLATGVLRYLEENPVLPKPRAVCLFSPWVDLRQGCEGLKQSPHYLTEWIPMGLLDWGIRAYVPKDVPTSHPYVSPMGNGFATSVPVFVQTCDQEVLYESNLHFVEGMRDKGTKVECYVMRNANHDAFAAAQVLGAVEKAKAAAAAAYQFVRSS